MWLKLLSERGSRRLIADTWCFRNLAGGIRMPQNKIYVGNIAYAAELEEIQSLFAPYGEIEDIAMAMDKETETFRGFAIVMMPNVEEAARAIAGVDGHQLRGRRLVVNQAVKKSALVKENATPVTIANRDGAAGLPRRIRKNVDARPRRSGRNPRRG